MNKKTLQDQQVLINDAIHGVISLPKKIVQNIIDQPTFQRLRHIKQLGMVDLIFPTAVHTRFSHCIGTAHVAYKMAKTLGINEEMQNYALIGALLHDIGHGPFSHAFENLLTKEILKNEKTTADDTKIKHEKWTFHFLKEYKKSLEEVGIEHNTINAFIQGKQVDAQENKNDTHKLVGDIISSQLDADRLDYLLRDSHFCGVSYGKADIEWILTHLVRFEDGNKPARLAVKKTAWRAVEHFLMCRRIMLQNIYTHPKKNILGKLLVEFLTSLAKFLQKEENKKEPIQNIALKKFLRNVGFYRTSEKTADEFIVENFSYYKSLTDYDIWMLIRDLFTEESLNKFKTPDITTAHQIAKRLYTRNTHQLFHFDSTNIDTVISIINKLSDEKKFHDWEIFISQNKVTSYEAEEDPILIFDVACKKAYPIQTHSNLLNHMVGKHEKESYLAVDQELWKNHKKLICAEFKKYVSFDASS